MTTLSHISIDCLSLIFHLSACLMGFVASKWGDEHGYYTKSAIGLFLAIGAAGLAVLDVANIVDKL